MIKHNITHKILTGSVFLYFPISKKQDIKNNSKIINKKPSYNNNDYWKSISGNCNEQFFCYRK